MHALIDFCIAYMHTDSAWGMVNMIQKSQSDSEQIIMLYNCISCVLLRELLSIIWFALH